MKSQDLSDLGVSVHIDVELVQQLIPAPQFDAKLRQRLVESGREIDPESATKSITLEAQPRGRFLWARFRGASATRAESGLATAIAALEEVATELWTLSVMQSRARVRRSLAEETAVLAGLDRSRGSELESEPVARPVDAVTPARAAVQRSSLSSPGQPNLDSQRRISLEQRARLEHRLRFLEDHLQHGPPTIHTIQSPSTKSAGRNWGLLPAALALAFLIAGATAVGVDCLDRRVHDLAQLESASRLPVLGSFADRLRGEVSAARVIAAAGDANTLVLLSTNPNCDRKAIGPLLVPAAQRQGRVVELVACASAVRRKSERAVLSVTEAESHDEVLDAWLSRSSTTVLVVAEAGLSTRPELSALEEKLAFSSAQCLEVVLRT